MKKKNFTAPAMLLVLLLTANSAIAQWTRNAPTSQTYLTNTGDNVGIGTTTPAFKLDIQGSGITTMSFKSTTDNASILLDKGATTKTASLTYRTAGVNNWQTGCVSNINYTIRNNGLGAVAIYCDAADNKVGIGTTTPSEKLTVNGNISGLGNITATGTLTATGGNSTNWNSAYGWGNHASAGYVTVESDPQVGSNTASYVPRWNGTALVKGGIYDNGTNIGIGTAAPGYLFDVQGIAASTAAVINSHVNYVGTSDVRAIQGVSHTADGWGYGVYGEGGWIGVYGYGTNATTTSFGV